MTPLQIKLARHALGFDADVKRSYRNRYFAVPGDSTSYDAWMTMLAEGDADGVSVAQKNRMTNFWLTRQGAEKVLREGESLDPEDF